MANLTVTAANVLRSAGGQSSPGIAGATITAGQALYLDPADGKMKLSDSNATAPANSITGIALNGASLNQPINYVTFDPLLVTGFTSSQGAVIYLSATPGALTDAEGDILGNVIFVGLMQTTTAMTLSPVAGPATA